MQRRRFAALSLVLAAALGLPGCSTVQNPVTGKAERTVMDERAELAEGAKQHQLVLADYGVYKDARLQAYVDEIGQRVARHSHRTGLKWHFTVLDSPEVNAFALPGGYVYVTRGIMAYMDSEADLAGVIGHEIAHVTARHGAQRATRSQTAGLGVLAASVLGAVLEARGIGGAGQLASQLSQGVAAGYVASYSREQELQADQLGAEYLARAGYDPRNMVDVIELLRNQERFQADLARAEGRAPRQGADWLASHPTNEQRLQQVTAIAAKYRSAGGYADEGRARYLRAIDGMPFGDSREQGVVRGRNFFHEPLGFAMTAPAGWKVRNATEMLALVNPAGDAGLIVQAVPPKAGATHEEILRNGLKAEQGRTERLTINGMAATRFAGTVRTQQGARPVEATVVTGPSGHNYVFLYAGRDERTLQAARGQLREAESSFRALTPADRAAARPWVVRAVPCPRGGIAELAARSPLRENAVQQLRLLNGVYAEGEPQVGQLVKVIE